MKTKQELKRFVKYNKQGKPYYSFNTLYELGNLITLSIKEGYESNTFRNRSLQSLQYDNMLFQGTRTMDEAIELLKYGWDYGTQKLLTELHVQNNKKTLKLEYDVVGGQVSVPRMLQGLPTNMIRTVMAEKPAKIINVYKAAGYKADYSESSIIKYSAKALQIVEALENKGYRVNLYVVKLNKKENEELFTQVKIKSSNERMNIRKVAFCLANPAFQRRILWRLTEMCDWIHNRAWVDGYGIPVDGFNPTKMSYEYKNYIEGDSNLFIPIEIENTDEFVKNLKLS